MDGNQLVKSSYSSYVAFDGAIEATLKCGFKSRFFNIKFKDAITILFSI